MKCTMLVQNLSEVPHEHLMLASLDKIQSPMFVPLTGVSARFKKKNSAETELSQSVLTMII